MRRWFGRLMREGARSERAGAEGGARVGGNVAPPADVARHEAVVRTLRDRHGEDRLAREKRRRWYPQHVTTSAEGGAVRAHERAPARLHRIPACVPCHVTGDARALLDRLTREFPRGSVTFRHLADGRQAVMLTVCAGAEPRQIGRVEHCVQTDPRASDGPRAGVSVETDDGASLVVRFRYPAMPSRLVSGEHDRADDPSDDAAHVDFSEIRPVLDSPPAAKAAAPPLVWVTRPPEAEALNAVRSRDYEALYARLKLEVLAGVWKSLSTLLANAPASQWHDGVYYTLVRDVDAANGRIAQRAFDDSGRVADIGAERTYDAMAATDLLLLYLDADILADLTDICFGLQRLPSSDGYFLKEELFGVIRRFWAGAQSLATSYGSDLPTVMRMALRAVPMPSQVPVLQQDWLALRQSLVDRYGEGGRKASRLGAVDSRSPRGDPSWWPFATFPVGDVNVGLRLVYRQEWRPAGTQRGEVIRRVAPPAPVDASPDGTLDMARRAAGTHNVETIIQHPDAPIRLQDLVSEARHSVLDTMQWPLDTDGAVDTGVAGFPCGTHAGLAEPGVNAQETCSRLTDVMRRMAARIGEERANASAGQATGTSDIPAEHDATATYVYSRLQSCYAVVTRPRDIENVVFIAEKLPAPAEIDRSWVRRHDWILSKALLDESFRDALATIGEAAPAEGSGEARAELAARRDRLYEHLRANILHYQRAIWRQEDPQQRGLRYRKSGRKLPLDWHFELQSRAALTLRQLNELLSAPHVNGQFAAYATGQTANLDQLIDVASPIGYYANFAIFRMRPEVQTADRLAILHFLKSQWMPGDPAFAPSEGADPPGVALAPERKTSASGPGHRVVLDTRGVVIDVIRPAPAPPVPATEVREAATGPEPAAPFQLMLPETGATLRLRRRDDENVAWTLPAAAATLQLSCQSHAGHWDVLAAAPRVIGVHGGGNPVRAAAVIIGGGALARGGMVAACGGRAHGSAIVGADGWLRPARVAAVDEPHLIPA